MVTIELPPEVETAPATEATAEPTAARRGQRPPLSARRGWRRDVVVKLLVNPTPVAETANLLEQQTGHIHDAFQPRNGWQDWITGTLATLMLRLNRCERIERKLRDYASYRAIDFWEDDQQLAVETLALKLGKEPAKTVARLRETPTGVDWLLARWRLLARVEPHAWSDEHRDLAARLVGGDPTVDPTHAGFVAGRIDELEAFRERVVEADAIVRGLVENDLSDERVPGLASLRRYARSLHRQLKWYVDQFHVEHPDRWDDPRRRPAIYGPAVEEFRAPDPNRFEGKPTPLYPVITPPDPAATTAPANGRTKPAEPDPAPAIEKTKPPGSNLEHEFKKAKPFDVSPAPEIKKAKPFEWIKASRIEDDAPADACPGPGVNGRGGAAVPPETR